MTCVDDCYTNCKSCLAPNFDCKTCSAIDNSCGQSELLILNSSFGLIAYAPSEEYKGSVTWYIETAKEDIDKVSSIYGFKPDYPLYYQFVPDEEFEKYIYNSPPETGGLYYPDYNTILRPISYLDDVYYRKYNYLDIHETTHAINQANCYSYTSPKQIYDDYYDIYFYTKLPAWTDEGLAQLMDYWVWQKYKSGGGWYMYYDISTTVDETILEEARNGDPHAQGYIFLYLQSKTHFSEPQLQKFIANLFKACNNTDVLLDNSTVINLWNDAVGRNETDSFKTFSITP
jgi:hypothetical protein